MFKEYWNEHRDICVICKPIVWGTNNLLATEKSSMVDTVLILTKIYLGSYMFRIKPTADKYNESADRVSKSINR